MAFEGGELSDKEECKAEEMVQEDLYAQIPEEQIGCVAGQDELHRHRHELDVDEADRLKSREMVELSSARGPVEQQVQQA